MKKLVLCISFLFFLGFRYVGSAEQDTLLIEDFRNLSRWVQSPEIKVPSGKYGWEPAVDEKGSRMWYLGTKGFRDTYYWYAYNMKPVEVAEFDYIVLKYKLGEGTRLTIDIWFDKKQVEPRPINYIKGTGEWEEVKIPIKGAKLTCIALSIGEHPNDTGEDRIYEAYFKEIKAVKEAGSIPDLIVLPTPKEMKLFGKTINLSSSGKILCSILIRKDATETEKIAAEELSEEIQKLSGINEKIEISAGDVIPEGKNVIFVIGVNHPLFKKFAVQPPLKKEGYTIKMIKDKDRDIIFLAGNDKTGAYWSVQTILQLIEKKYGEIILHLAEINDWPTYLYRSTAVSADMEANIKALRYKINVLFNPWWSLGKKWREPDENYIKAIQEQTEFCAKRGVNLTQQICPYDVDYKLENPGQIQISNPADIDKLFQIFELSLSKGSRIINLSFDDPSRHKESFHPEDVKFFNGDVLKGHAYLVAELCKRLKKKYPDAILTITTRDYESANGVTGYYNKVGVPSDVIIMWTGYSGVTLSYEEEGVKRFKDGIEGRRFVVFDNTPGQMYGYGKNIRIFDSYAAEYDGLWEYCYGIHGMHRFSNPPFPWLSDALGMIMAEYMWNADNYDAEKTVRKVIVKVAGKKAVEPLLSFKYHYLRIVAKYPVWKEPAKISNEEKNRYKIDDDRYNKIKIDIDALKDNLEKIKTVSINKEIIGELETLYRWVVEGIELLRIRELKTYKPNGEISFLPDDFFGGSGYTVYSYLCEPKKAVWIYGKRTTTHTLEAKFKLSSLPQSDATLTIEGQDDDKEGKTKIEISINGNILFNGPNHFIEKGWSKISYPIKKSFLKIGENILVIRNLEDSDSFNSKWFMVSEAKIVF